MEEMVQRIGAVSRLTGLRYWSTTHQQWQTLIVEASALTGPQGNRRNDFTPEELTSGSTLFFEQQDNLAGKADYEMKVSFPSPSRIVVSVENITAMRYLLITLFHPHELQTFSIFDHECGDVWRYYSVVRSGKGASGLTTGKEASSINRGVAFYRHFAGIPADVEPPVAR
jgi:hypothetical protein